MAKEKSKERLKLENHFLRRASMAISVTTIANNFIKWGAMCLLARYGYLTVAALSGKYTDAHLVLNFLFNLGINKWLAYLLAGGGVTYGIAERRLRKRTTKKLTGRIADFEKAHDPKRTSSQLAKDGSTNPADQVG